MEKVIYENESSKLIADVEGGIVQLIQSLNGEVIGTVSMYFEEVKVLTDFISDIKNEY